MGQGSNDILRGGWGNDWLRGSAGIDNLGGGPGQDTLIGDSGIDRVVEVTLSGNLFLTDTTLRDVGNDSLDGGSGSDTMLGEAGADTIEARDNQVDTLAASGNGTSVELGDTLLTDPVDVISEAFILFPSWADGLP